MHEPPKSIALLPFELAEELDADGVVARLPVVRSDGPITPDLIVGGIHVATTLVTFAQIPQTFTYLSAAIARWRKGAAAEAVMLTVEASGPRGRVTLELDQVSSVSEIEGIVKLVAEEAND